MTGLQNQKKNILKIKTDKIIKTKLFKSFEARNKYQILYKYEDEWRSMLEAMLFPI